MSFVNLFNVSTNIITGNNIVYDTLINEIYTISSSSNTSLDNGGIDINGNGTLTLFKNNDIIFGGGGSLGSLNAPFPGSNALQIEEGIIISTIINMGSLCGGGGGYNGNGGQGNGGAGGGGAYYLYGGNGLNEQGGGGMVGGGGGGFNAPGGGGINGPGGFGFIAGGGAGFFLYNSLNSANNFGGGGGYQNSGGGGAGGGNGSSLTGGGGGGGGGSGGPNSANGGYSINNLGTITTLENQQGIGFGLGALFYQGILPNNYNIIIQGDNLYGQLFYTGWANSTPGIITFNISDQSSTLPDITTSYEAVLVNIIPSILNGVFSTNGNSYLWNLTLGQNVFVSGRDYISYDLTINKVIYPCFKEGTKILTNDGYRYIQDLRKGNKIKTLKHGFIPIELIGKREIIHNVNNERIKDQLYLCNKKYYPELIEDLIITGCHSILVDNFINHEEKEKTIVINGEIFITDNKYRLPACVDERAFIYPIKGTYTIYHLALENKDYYMNYGIYANGLLVESCSQRYLKEISGMELID